MSMHPKRNLFVDYKKDSIRTFVETGTYRGDGIQLALEAGGFDRIFSIDVDPEAADFCKHRFPPKQYGNQIHIFTGDSTKILPDIIRYINEPIMFWLDAHAQYFEDEKVIGEPYPLLKELDIIQHFSHHNNVILIDDMLHLTHPEVTGWTKKQIEAKLRAMYENAVIEYHANPVKNSILSVYEQ